MNALFVCSVAFVALTSLVVGESIHDIICNQEFIGYKVDYARRKCIRRKARGCRDPFPYKTRRECMSYFQGKDLCDSSPCRHNGVCLSVTTKNRRRTFKCDCYETGYYGRRCHRKCPKILSRSRRSQEACIQI